MTTVSTLSIVCPAFEEEAGLPHFHRELSAALAPLEATYAIEILYVDDGSRDGTLDVLRKLARSDQRVRFLSLSRNFGHQAALTAGLEHARGDAVVTLDSDLQHPPVLIPVLVEHWCRGHDVVVTVRADDPTLGWFKRWSSSCFYRLMRFVGNVEIRAAAADFRLLSRRAVDALLQLRESHRFLRGMVQWLGLPTTAIHFVPGQRRAGISKYSLGRQIRLACDGIVSFSRLPLRISIGLGLLCFLAAGAVACIAIARSFSTTSAQSWSWLALFFSLYVVGGAILIGLGVVGEYVGRIHDEVRWRPLYLVKEHWPDEVQPGASGRRQAA